MSDPAAIVAPADSLGPHAERQFALLERLAEFGLEVAGVVAARVKAAGPDEDLDVLARAYARVARAVRQTVMLQSKLVKDAQAFEAAPERQAARAEAAQEAARRDPLHLRKARVERIIERVVRTRHGDDEDRLERLMVEACERLDDEDLYRDIMTRQIGELVALICRDLGLSPDWARLAEEAWARDEIAEGDPRSPFVAMNPDQPRPPPQAGEVAQGAGGGIPPPLPFELQT